MNGIEPIIERLEFTVNRLESAVFHWESIMIRLDRIEQRAKAQTWWLRATVTAIFGLISKWFVDTFWR